MIEAEFTFYDRMFENAHEFSWECQLGHVPRKGDRISLPDTDELRQGRMSASYAVVEEVVWYLADGDEADSVTIHCCILWESMDNP